MCSLVRDGNSRWNNHRRLWYFPVRRQECVQRSLSGQHQVLQFQTNARKAEINKRKVDYFCTATWFWLYRRSERSRTGKCHVNPQGLQYFWEALAIQEMGSSAWRFASIRRNHIRATATCQQIVNGILLAPPKVQELLVRRIIIWQQPSQKRIPFSRSHRKGPNPGTEALRQALTRTMQYWDFVEAAKGETVALATRVVALHEAPNPAVHQTAKDTQGLLFVGRANGTSKK